MLLIREDVNKANSFLESKISELEPELKLLQTRLNDFANNSDSDLKGIDWKNLFNNINNNQKEINYFNKYMSQFKQSIVAANNKFIEYINEKPSDFVRDINDEYLSELNRLKNIYVGKVQNLKYLIEKPAYTYRYDTKTGKKIYTLVTNLELLRASLREYQKEIDKYEEWIAFLEKLAPTNAAVNSAINAINIINFNNGG